MLERVIGEFRDAWSVIKDAHSRKTVEDKIGFFALTKGFILSLLIVPQLGIYGDLQKSDPQFLQVMVGFSIWMIVFNWYVKDKDITEVFALQNLSIVAIVPMSLSFIWWKNPYALVLLEEVIFIWLWVINKHLRDSMDNAIADKVDFRNLRMRTQNLNILGAFIGFPVTFFTNTNIDPFTMMAFTSTAFIGLIVWERNNILKPYLDE